jgi:hypothetical protein
MWSGSKGIKSTSTIQQPSFGEFFLKFFIGTKGFSTFSIVYTVDEGVQKNGLVFSSNLKWVC